MIFGPVKERDGRNGEQIQINSWLELSSTSQVRLSMHRNKNMHAETRGKYTAVNWHHAAASRPSDSTRTHISHTSQQQLRGPLNIRYSGLNNTQTQN